MTKKSKIKKSINFYKKEMKKWEFRIIISLIIIVLEISIVYFLYLKSNNWDISNTNINLYTFSKFSILSPFIFCLSFSARQFNYYKKQMDLYKLKYTDL